MENELARKVIKKYEDLKAERMNWDSHWDEVAKFVVPRKDNVYGQATIGEKRANRLFDTEGIRACDELAAALHGMLTNPATIWFGLSTGDPAIDKKYSVSFWLHDCTRKMINVLNNSNFQQEILETFTDLGSIGTNSLRIEDDKDEVVKFHSEPVYNVLIDDNSKGDIDTVVRCYKFDKRQILQEFGDSLSEEDKKSLGDAPEKKWEIIHEVSPRNDEEMKKGLGNKGYKYKSIHVLRDKGIVLSESGFKSFPFAVPRWSKINKEKYGRSPAMKVLADIKMMNMMKKVTIQGAQLSIAPPLQVPDTGFLAPLKLSPYSTNYRRTGLKDRVEPLFTGADPRIGFELLEMVKMSIRQAFFLDKLNVDLGDRATATEVLQRKDEQLRTLGPVLGRLNRELLKPIIDRVFAIMEDRDMFLETPAEIKNAELDIKYVSAIAQAQMAAESDSMMRAINASSAIIQMDPTVMDNIDGDAFLRKNLEIFGVDPSILRKPNAVEVMRQQRAQQAQREQEMMESQVGAEVVNKVGGANAIQQGGQG